MLAIQVFGFLGCFFWSPTFDSFRDHEKMRSRELFEKGCGKIKGGKFENGGMMMKGVLRRSSWISCEDLLSAFK